MTGLQHMMVRVPDLAPVTLSTFLIEHAAPRADLVLVFDLLRSGAAVSVPLVDGRSVILERQGYFIVGTALPAECADREACLTAIGHVMAGHFIPGGTVDVWLAPVSTFALLGLMGQPCGTWREALLAEVGRARGATARTVLEVRPVDCTPLGLSFHAACIHMAWMACTVARAALTVGRPDLAKDALRPVGRALAEIPAKVATHFVPRLDALYAEAEAMQARQRSDEVA